MQATGSSLMRRLASVIHPPLPLDARQTKALLTALTSSFQRHLDASHPTPSTTRKKQDPAVSSFVEAEKHFDFILTHPIFGGSSIHTGPNPDSLEKAALSCFALFQAHLKNATLDNLIVSRCIKSLSMTSLSPQKKRELSLGLRITNLLRTTDQVSLRTALSVASTPADWCSLMFDENHEEHVWNFLKEEFSTKGQLSVHKRSTNVILLHAYILNAVQRHGFGSTFNALFTAMNDSQVPEKLRASLLQFSASHTSNLLWRDQKMKVESPEEYDRLATKLSALHVPPKFRIHQQFNSAVMQLLHPQTPSPTSLKQFIEHLSDNPADFDRASNSVRRRENILRATLQAASLYFSNGSYKDAQSMLQFAQINFPSELRDPNAEETSLPISQSQAPESSDSTILSRLDGLLAT